MTGYPPLELREVLLERLPGRVLNPRVFISLVLAKAQLHIGRRLVDRHRHGPGPRVRRLPGMDGAGRESEASGRAFHCASMVGDVVMAEGTLLKRADDLTKTAG